MHCASELKSECKLETFILLMIVRLNTYSELIKHYSLTVTELQEKCIFRLLSLYGRFCFQHGGFGALE